MTEQQQQKVSFTPFLSETFDLQQLKRLVMYDIDEIDNRAADIPVHLRLLFSQVAALMTPYENAAMMQNIESITQYSNALISASNDENDDSTYTFYRTKLITATTDFLTEFSSLLLAHGLSYSLEKNKASTPFDLLKSILDIPGYRNNTYGFPISYQQRLLAEFALQRLQSNYDLIMLIVGKRGRGKSTFGAEVISTYLELQGKPFGVQNVMLTESKEQMFNAIKTWKPGDGYIFDEAINQLFSRDFFRGGDFISLLTEIRYKRSFAAFLIPELFQIDKIVRDSLADVVVQITERGLAILMSPSLLSGEQRYAEAKPDAPVLTPQAHSDYLIKKSMNSIVTIPFWEISSANQFWKEYNNIKDNKINARKFMKPQGYIKKKKASDFYYELCINIANTLPNAHRVGESYVEQYSLQKNYKLTARGFAMWLALQLGLGRHDLLLQTAEGEVVDISLPLVQSYLAKLKVLSDGAKREVAK